jgi:hypothetical protein
MLVGMFSGGVGAGGRAVSVPKRKDLNAPHILSTFVPNIFTKQCARKTIHYYI